MEIGQAEDVWRFLTCVVTFVLAVITLMPQCVTAGSTKNQSTDASSSPSSSIETANQKYRVRRTLHSFRKSNANKSTIQ